jgi:hypothetical protein
LVGLVGEKSRFIILFKWPENVSQFEYAEPDQNFLQVTGTQKGLTVELMRDGHLFTVGHPQDDAQPVALQRKDGTAVEVNQNEILSTEEAVGLFSGYVETESLDASAWTLREIPLGSEEEASASGSSSAGVSYHGSPTPAPDARPQSRRSGDDGGHGDDTGKARS